MKAIIFDMDGVIIDSEPVHEKLEKELLEELGGSISDEDYLEFVGRPDEYMWSTFKERYYLKQSVEELVSLKKKRFMEVIHEVPLVDNFKEVLDYFYHKGYKIALASSNNRKVIDYIVEQFDLSQYFDVTMSGEEVTHGKPNPEIFLKTAEKMNVSPAECLVFEDAANGVVAAKDAGMKCIGLDNSSSAKQNLSKADLVIERFEDLDIEKVLLDLNK